MKFTETAIINALCTSGEEMLLHAREGVEYKQRLSKARGSKREMESDILNKYSLGEPPFYTNKEYRNALNAEHDAESELAQVHRTMRSFIQPSPRRRTK